jgi:DNA polymerase-3 subunit beta
VRLTTKAGDLAAAAAYAGRAVEKKAKIPILGNLLVDASNGTVTLAATDLDRMAHTECAAEIDTPGAVAVPAERFGKLLSSLDGDTVVKIESSDGVATVASGRSRYRLPTLPAGDFPTPLAVGDNACQLALDSTTALRLFERPAVAICREGTRYYLNGIYLHADEDGRLVAVATDGHQLVRVVADMPAPKLPGNGGRPGVIVPAAACAEIVKLAKAGEVALRIDGRIIEARAGSQLFCSKTISGTFPDYSRVIPAVSGHAVECERAALIAALERALAVVDKQEKLPVARLAWREDELALTLPDDTGIDTIAATSREPGWTAVSLHRLLNLLDAFDGERVTLDAGNHYSPVRLTVSGDDDLLAILMPCAWRGGAP